MKEFRVRKILPDGTVKVEYRGTLREKTDEYISIDTGWSREPLDLDYVLFEPDDRWVETFYFHRWYNIFRISSADGYLKGFYINISKPPVVKGEIIDWTDLAIDVWVRPDGSYLVLDLDEFRELEIPEDTREIALGALDEVKELAGELGGPLSKLG